MFSDVPMHNRNCARVVRGAGEEQSETGDGCAQIATETGEEKEMLRLTPPPLPWDRCLNNFCLYLDCMHYILKFYH